MKYLNIILVCMTLLFIGCQPQAEGDVTPEDVAALVIRGNNQLENSPEAAIQSFEQAKTLSNQLGEDTHLPVIYQRLGYLYLTNHQYAEASTYLKDALNLGLENKDQYAKVFYYLGMVSQQFNDYASAAAYYDKSLTIFFELEDLEMTSQTQMKLGQCFRELKMYDQALNTLKLAETTAAEQNITDLHNSILISIGVVHFKKKDFNKAILHYNKALQQTADEATEATLHHDLALVYVASKDPVLATIHFDKAIDRYARLNLKSRCFHSYSGKAEVLALFGDTKGAQQCLEKAMDIAAQGGVYYTEVVNQAHKQLVQIYTDLGRYKDAVVISEQLHRLKDQRLAANAAMQYELDQLKLTLADQAIAHNDEVKQMQAEAQDGLLYTSFLIAALLGALVMSWQSKRKAQAAEAKLKQQ